MYSLVKLIVCHYVDNAFMTDMQCDRYRFRLTPSSACSYNTIYNMCLLTFYFFRNVCLIVLTCKTCTCKNKQNFKLYYTNNTTWPLHVFFKLFKVPYYASVFFPFSWYFVGSLSIARSKTQVFLLFYSLLFFPTFENLHCFERC